MLRFTKYFLLGAGSWIIPSLFLLGYYLLASYLRPMVTPKTHLFILAGGTILGVTIPVLLLALVGVSKYREKRTKLFLSFLAGYLVAGLPLLLFVWLVVKPLEEPINSMIKLSDTVINKAHFWID